MASKRKRPLERVHFKSAAAVRQNKPGVEIISQSRTKIGDVDVTFTVGRITKEDRVARNLALIDHTAAKL